MKVKISTNGKFHAITVLEPILAANMTAALHDLCEPFLQQEVKSVLLNLKDIQKMDSAAAEAILELRNLFYTNRASFVLCEPQPPVKKYLDQNEQFETLQIAPTQSEASDIIFMEEIEREFSD
ncbi:MAG TPA: STAS domain-containing protein [Puia sp.]|jgi:anti-anti-sigma factor|nr:STAS domain-containing protein [Puia sp.]